jgi:hypothetical protein
MTDEQHESLEQENKSPVTDEPASNMRGTDEIDVESALAALSSLHSFVEDEADVEEETDDVQADDEALIVSDDADDEVESVAATAEEDDYIYADVQPVQSDFARPPLSVVHRGQAASIVPAALLIGAGALLTILLTASADATLNIPLVTSIGVSGLGLVLIAYWLSSSRWTTGSFLMGMCLLLVGGVLTYLVLPTNLDVVSGYPLLFTAIGTAFVLTDLVSPTNRRLWLVGLMFAIGGFAGLAITAQLLPETVVNTAGRFLPVVLIVLVGLLIVPIFRRNG